MNSFSFGNTLMNLRPTDLRRSPAMAHMLNSVAAPLRLGSDDVPSNAQILAAAQQFYAGNQVLVDTTTTDTQTGSQNNPSYVSQMNGYNWQAQQLTSDETGTAGNGIFGNSGSGSGGGIWGPTLDKVTASDLFSTIAVGVNADVQFIVGGAGGLGAAFDITKRVPTKGYGYATGELGLRIDVSLNLQCLVLNKLPTELTLPVYGLTVSTGAGINLAFSVFYTSPGTTLLGYAIGVGVGLGGGATVFGGKMWSFG